MLTCLSRHVVARKTHRLPSQQVFGHIASTHEAMQLSKAFVQGSRVALQLQLLQAS
jgi:hypothetical protein